MQSRVDATQFIGKLRGATQSVLTRCSNDCYYVVKFTNNPEGLIAILSEVITARLGSHLGLPMPSFEYIHVGKWLLDHSPDIRISVGGTSTNYDPGLHFGSKTPCRSEGANGLCLPSPLLIARIADPATFAGALVLDAWTGGADRREVIFARSALSGPSQPQFIDHHQSFNGWDDPFRSPNSTPHYFRTEFYDFIRGWLSFEPWLSIAETTNSNTLHALVRNVAPEWHVSQSFQDAIVTHLIRRQRLIRSQIAHLRDRETSLFLNWNRAQSVRNGTA